MNKHRSRPSPFRNAVDLNDRVQVKVLRKRLKLSEAGFADAVQKSGGSIAALVKQATTSKTVT
jgi:DNA-binding transcriptional regulator YiaG